MKRIPAAVARDVFMEGKGDMLASTAGLGCPKSAKKFLRNRIEMAFLAGWEAAELRLTKPYDPATEGRITPGL